MSTSHPKKIIVGLSGGVDSSVAAYLLHAQGHQVEGVFMKNWEADDDDLYCTAAQDFADAQAVAVKIGIPLHAVNFSKEYWDRVFKYFLNEYAAGRTPNPDVLCNKEIKFKAFLDHALKLGADFIATGHYARCQVAEGGVQLQKAVDPDKDQSYFLSLLNQEQLRHSLFPIGELTKPEVRKIAETQGFITHNKKDSTGICFIGERRFKDFIHEFLPAKPGLIKSIDGSILGRHQGLMSYTIGQRQGLGIGGQKNGAEEPWFVASKNVTDNTLIVVQGHDHPALLSTHLLAQTPHWIEGHAPKFPLECTAKIRYRQPDQPCVVHREGENLRVDFHEPQRGVTPGQIAVFYTGNVCLGGATIVQ